MTLEAPRRAPAAAAFIAAISLAGLSGHALAQAATQADPHTEAGLLKAEDALFDADVKGDVAAIQRGFADEAVFIHANGMSQSKADYLQATAAHKFPLTAVAGSDRTVRVFGDVGVIRGTKTITLGDMHLSGTYLTVYVWRDNRWQMLDEQSSPSPEKPK